VTDVLKTGGGVGVKEWLTVHGDNVKSEAVEKQRKWGAEQRSLEETTRNAVEEGGSSCSNFSALIE